MGCVRKGLSTRDLVAILSTLFLEPHSPVCSCKTLVHCNLPTLCWIPGQIAEKEILSTGFKRALGFLTVSLLSLLDRIPAKLYHQMLYGHLLLAVLLLARDPDVGLRPHIPQG